MAFQLVEAGFDVWLGNNRGNIYSRGHVEKTVEGDYFNYSFWELGKYDLPAMIDRIRDQTDFDHVSYIGHSQGTTQMFSALAENHGQLQQKIKAFIAMAPVIRLDHVGSDIFKHLAQNIDSI